MMSNVERMDFVIWASPLFPGFTTNYEVSQKALIAWDMEKKIRALEAKGCTRSDAQGIVEVDTIGL
jgi:hypothetical protein